MFTISSKMKVGALTALAFLIAGIFMALGYSAAFASGSGSQQYPDRLIVAFDRGVSDAREAKIIDAAGVTPLQDLPLINAVVVDVGASSERVAALRELKLIDQVQYVEPDYKVTALATPTDPMFSQLWGMSKIGAPTAWDKYAGGSVTVAVTDTGIDPSHPDLDGNLWVNPREVAGNNIDDDKNGVVDDVNGVNFYDGDSSGNPSDDEGHGTHVAGTIAAESGNGIGVVGVNPQAKILSAKFLGRNGGYTSDAIRAIDYARSMGAKVMNASWGGGDYSKALEEAIARSGMLFVAAAGNSGSDNDDDPAYPASYELDNVVSVAASDQSDSLARFSNYGSCSVDLAAPGTDIVSTVPGDDYASYDGTSMASPHVAGVAALLAARDSKLTPLEIKARLMDSVDKPSALAGTSVTGGRLNARKALDSTASKPPVGCSAPYVKPVLSITGATLRNVKRTGKVTFTVRCNVEPCQAKLGVTIRSSKGAKVARASKSQAGGTKKVVVSVKLTANQRKSLTKALRNRGKVNATITGYAVDGDGHQGGTVTKKIRIIG